MSLLTTKNFRDLACNKINCPKQIVSVSRRWGVCHSAQKHLDPVHERRACQHPDGKPTPSFSNAVPPHRKPIDGSWSLSLASASAALSRGPSATDPLDTVKPTVVCLNENPTKTTSGLHLPGTISVDMRVCMYNATRALGCKHALLARCKTLASMSKAVAPCSRTTRRLRADLRSGGRPTRWRLRQQRRLRRLM